MRPLGKTPCCFIVRHSRIRTITRMPAPSLTIERIYPQQLDAHNHDDRETLRIHMERYEFAAARLTGMRVLDMACGCGYGSDRLAELNPDKTIVGVDIDPAAIAFARAHYQRANVSSICADAETSSALHRCATIVSLETIEHLPRPQALISNCATLLAEGGQIIAS